MSINAIKPTLLRLCGLILATGAVWAEVPPRSQIGQTLAVPDADFDRGQIFYILPGQDTQLALTSVGPLQRMIITTSRGVGYVVATFDPEDSEKPILGGALRVPVASLASDSPAIDGLLRGENGLHEAEHSEITFELTGATEVEKLASEDEDVFPYDMKLSGKLTVRGVTKDVEMVAEVRFMLTNWTTFARSVGDLITIAGRFEVKPADFGWEPSRGDLTAESLSVDVFLLGSTRSPENNLNPNLDLERWRAERRYLTQALDFNDSEAASAVGGEFLTKYGDDASALNSLARLILEAPGLRTRDLGLASRLVQRAQKLDAEGEETAETLALLEAAMGGAMN